MPFLIRVRRVSPDAIELVTYGDEREHLQRPRKLISCLRELSRNRNPMIVGIDGCGGAGKSTLAKYIQENFSNVKIVQVDDFYFHDHFDWEKLKMQFLIGSAKINQQNISVMTGNLKHSLNGVR